MAGSNQHNIPQSLLRGFRVPGGSKSDSRTWVYEKGSPPELKRIKHEVGAELYFYSHLSPDGSKTLDDEITEYEDSFARLLQTFRQAPLDAEVNPDSAAEVVAHLTIRNAHLRQTFTRGAQLVFGRAVELFTSEAGLRSMLGVDREYPTERVKELIDEHMKENPAFAPCGLPAQVLHQIAQMTLREKFNSFFAAHVPLMAVALDDMASQASAFVRDGHNKALSSGLAPDGRTDRLRALTWQVMLCPNEGFVLPDCVALGVDGEGRLKPLILADLDEVTVVLMPISTTRMLVGRRPPAMAPDLSQFNEAAASASLTFFVAARIDDGLAGLAGGIGESCAHFLSATIDSVFDEFQRERTTSVVARDTESVIEGGGLADSTGARQSHIPPYSLHFLSCADQATADRVNQLLASLIATLVEVMPLDRLDGITFASDYPAALRELDRGFPASGPLQPMSEEYGVSVAMAPLIMRDGVPKTHIVMRGDVAHSLASEDESQVRFALHIIVGQLAHAACAQILDESLPGVWLKPYGDRYQGFLYSAVHSAWTGYFSARVSASLCPEMGTGKQELLVSALKRAQIDISAARLTFRFHGNIDRLLKIVLPQIADILRFAGAVTGHYDGIQQSFLEDPALAEALEQTGLRDWLSFFDSELSRLWDRRGRWASFEEFLMLNRHVERLFWLYGIFPWKTDSGEIHVAVPLAVDAAKLVGLRPQLRLMAAMMAKGIKRSLLAVRSIVRRRAIRRIPKRS